MKALVQRVIEASVTVEATSYRASIGAGLCVLLGVEKGDTPKEAEWIAAKLARLRIFRDEEGRMNRSVKDIGGGIGGEIGGEILLISQFTLAGDCRKGNRPSFVNAADPAVGEALYELVATQLRRDHELVVRTGQFGATMQVALINDGPVTIMVERSPPAASAPP